MRKKILVAITIALVSSSTAMAGDFPLASCKSWDATLMERTGTNTKKAAMTGQVTQADFAEYCERDPGGETVQHGGKLTVDQCIARYEREVGNPKYRTVADCAKRTLTFFPPKGGPKSVSFPLPEDADTSCASGLPPLVGQFKLLCPNVAAKYNIQ